VDEGSKARTEWLESWLRLTLLPEVSAPALRRLLRDFGTPEEVLAAASSALEARAGALAAAAILRGPEPALLDRTRAWLENPEHHLLTLGDARYPGLLLQTADPPPVLYARGRLELLQRPALAIVGSRNPTPAGASDAQAFARALSDAGLTVVSGLAAGVDAAAHRGGLDGASSSIAVFATGLDRVYPARHRALADELARDGAVVSEFPLGTPPAPYNFPRRNRIISGLARGCLVVEAALRSGSLITARLALEQGREVLAIPGSIHSPLSKGCHWLIKQGAKLVESVQDAVAELGLPVAMSTRPSAPSEPRSTQARDLLGAMGFEPVDADTLCARSGLTPDAASAILLTLELDGWVGRLPGGLFQRVR
jgi:DNA processing protein